MADPRFSIAAKEGGWCACARGERAREVEVRRVSVRSACGICILNYVWCIWGGGGLVFERRRSVCVLTWRNKGNGEVEG